jgi:hypothetical protein
MCSCDLFVIEYVFMRLVYVIGYVFMRLVCVIGCVHATCILHNHRCEDLKSYMALTGWALYGDVKFFHVRYELGSYIPEDGVLYSHRRENLKSYIALTGCIL